MDYKKNNNETYERSYEAGWGNLYTDTIWVSIFNRIVRKNLIKKEKINILDFGCSLGANSRFFRNLGYNVYGIDIAQSAIDKCINVSGFERDKFIVVDLLNENKSLEELFDVKFDIIFASEVLYYFNDNDMKKILSIFNEGLSEQGLFLASMITYTHPMYKMYKIDNKRRFVKVSDNNSITEALYVNILYDENDMLELFDLFECVKICKSVLDLDEEIVRLDYIGKKR